MNMDWINTLRKFGARYEDIVLLKDVDRPSILPYLDLVQVQSKRSVLMPEAVVQVQRQPLLYLYSEAQFSKAPQEGDRLTQIKKLMAMRGDAAIVGIHSHGVLTLHSTARDTKSKNQISIKERDKDAPWLIPRLAQGESPVSLPGKFIEQQLFKLLEASAEVLQNAGLSLSETVSLTGRAVFLRFLLDRDILRRDQVAPFLNQESPERAFDNVKNSALTSRWLDRTLNGDLLPLPVKDSTIYFNDLAKNRKNEDVFKALQAILHFADPLGDGAYQFRLDWGDLHLAHVPVGILSQVYERHMEIFHPYERKATSAYYTPRHIAEFMVDEAFYGLDQDCQVNAKVLDPAAGAGVFLVAAFHKLVEAHWLKDGKRPDRATLQYILNNQIRGFDINRHALKLAALSLYLTRLELDPDPSPMEALRFETLQDKVLFNWSGQDDNTEVQSLKPVAGSLGSLVGAEHDGAYDIVIGNPPWSTHEDNNHDLQILYTKVSRLIAEARNVPNANKLTNPDGVPDLPFLWRSMQWARPGGRVALALHARWLFKQTVAGIQSRNAILHALKITGVLNGAALNQTEVWPNVQAPFSLLFAENFLPKNDSGFFFVSPQLEPALNREGKFRIDTQAAVPVSNQEAIDKAWLLKSMFRGCRLSSEIIEKISCRNLPTVEQYWKANGLAIGRGYETGKSGNQDSDFLFGRLDVTAAYNANPFRVEAGSLKIFERQRVYRRKEPKFYQQPLVLIRASLRVDRDLGRALLVNISEDVTYCESYIGLSCFGHQNPERISQYITLLFHSQFLLFFLLSTSSKYGVERPSTLVEDFKRIPFVSLEQLTQGQLDRIELLANQILNRPLLPPWKEIDILIGEIYDLNRMEIQVINDTLSTYLPSPLESKQAANPGSHDQKEQFKKTLFEAMQPFFNVTGRSLRISFCANQSNTPWAFIDIDTTGLSSENIEELPINILEKADDLMVSRIIHTWSNHPGRLRVGILDQYRYWTVTQARMLAADILRNYGHQLEQGI